MNYSARPGEQRRAPRARMELPAQISIGSQLSLQGKLKDLSLKSAFIALRESVYLRLHDEVGFSIQRSPGNADDMIQGLARVSRIAAGEGMAIYFTRMDDGSAGRLKDLLAR